MKCWNTPQNVTANGKLLKQNTFITEMGTYRISIYLYKGYVIFFKTRNDNLVECAILAKVTD